MHNSGEELDRDEFPAVPPKGAATRLPPKNYRHSEANLNARLGIAQKKHCSTLPPDEDFRTNKRLNDIHSSYEEKFDDDSVSSSSKNVARKPLQNPDFEDAFQESSQHLNRPDQPDTARSATKFVRSNIAPIPAPRSSLRKVEATADVTACQILVQSDSIGNTCNRKNSSDSLASSTDNQGTNTTMKPKPVIVEESKVEIRNLDNKGNLSVLTTSEVRKSVADTLATFENVGAKQRDNCVLVFPDLDNANSVTRQQTKLPGKLKIDGLLAKRITTALTQRPASSGVLIDSSAESAVAPPSVSSVTTRSTVDRDHSFKSKQVVPLSPEVQFSAGSISDDCISDGGEFYDDDDDDVDVEFSRPSEDVLLKSIPIVANQKHKAKKKKVPTATLR